ncbi:hypothetical protein [Microbacterium sp.]|uniref:hypothetical protein n=1 Tax=Microbacterium sp. TaxID=51671 RepID=UPI001AD3D70F|nr:hypothetical protein [Microbacterium sp.]MBN9193744.1 hypothetical protein [Microbacterium sp.]
MAEIGRPCDFVEGAACPLPAAEDRIDEASHFVLQLQTNYHDPRAFRFNLNALLAAVASTRALLQMEMQKHGLVKEWKVAREPFWGDPVLTAFHRSRNVTLHQEAIYDGSRIDVGLYRGRRMKLSLQQELRADRTSAEILAHSIPQLEKVFLDPTHSALGEQGGLERRYFIRELSADEDALTVSRKGLIRLIHMIATAHVVVGVLPAEFLGDHAEDDQEFAVPPKAITVLLESDVDPSLPGQWGWE